MNEEPEETLAQKAKRLADGNILLNATSLMEYLPLTFEDFAVEGSTVRHNAPDSADDDYIFSYYFVSDWLYAKLKERHQPVAQFGEHYLWGRLEMGQLIMDDMVIREIAAGQ